MSDSEVQDAYNDAKGKDQKRYERELKARGKKNQDKDRSSGDVRKTAELFVPNPEPQFKAGMIIFETVDAITDAIWNTATESHRPFWVFPVPFSLPFVF